MADALLPMKISHIQQLVLMMIAIVSFTVAIALLMFAGLPQHADYSGFILDGIYVAPEIGQVAPPIEAETFSGDELHLHDYQGETVIINFWATWCVPCAIEMPELQALYEETNVTILGVNIAESPSAIATWIDRFGITFSIVVDPQGEIYRNYRLVGQPTTYIINPNGIITHIFYGSTTADTLLSAIETYSLDG